MRRRARSPLCDAPHRRLPMRRAILGSMKQLDDLLMTFFVAAVIVSPALAVPAIFALRCVHSVLWTLSGAPSQQVCFQP